MIAVWFRQMWRVSVQFTLNIKQKAMQILYGNYAEKCSGNTM